MMKKIMFIITIYLLVSFLEAAGVFSLVEGQGDIGFEGAFEGNKIHARVDKENLINKSDNNVVGYLYYNYFDEGINIHLVDLNFYEKKNASEINFESKETGNINFWFEAYTYNQGRARKNDTSTYIIGNPHTYSKLVIFPILTKVKKTDSWNTQNSILKKIKKMTTFNNLIINQEQHSNRWIDGILPDENIYYSINTYLPKDKMATIEILLLKSDNIYRLLPYLDRNCRSELLIALDLPKNAQKKYNKEVKKLIDTINQMKQDEFETSNEFQSRLKKAHELRYKDDMILVTNLENWIEEDMQNIETSEERIEITDFSFGYYNADEKKLPIKIMEFNGYITISPQEAKMLKTKKENMVITAIRKMNIDMSSYSYSNITIEHPDLDKAIHYSPFSD
jgi:hypothetical protein